MNLEYFCTVFSAVKLINYTKITDQYNTCYCEYLIFFYHVLDFADGYDFTSELQNSSSL